MSTTSARVRRRPDGPGHERLPVDGPVRRLAGVGLRLLRRPAVQLRRAELRAVAAGPGDRLAGRQGGDAALGRHLDVDPAGRVGGRRHPVRPDRRPHRPRAHADADDAALRAGDRLLRGRAEHLGADRLPRGRQPGHRRRVGGRRGDGRRGRPRAPARRSRRAAVHVGAGGAVPGDVRQFPDRGRRDEGVARDLLALRLPVRPHPGGRRVDRPPVRRKSRSGGPARRRRPRARGSASCSRARRAR